MAALPSSDRLLFSPPKTLTLSPRKPLLPCPCSAGASEDLNSSLEYSSSSTGRGKEGNRRRAVRIAWEKLIRWSRSWRSRNNSDVLERTKKVVVLGGGSFGTAMAAHVASKKAEMEVYMLLRDDNICHNINETHINSKYFPGHKLPENIHATTCAREALAGADFCFHAVPVQFILSREHLTTR